MSKYYMLYKPFGMLSQFTREAAEQVTLADLGLEFPKDVYPVGRLDKDSEGMLFLTNDKTMTEKLLNPKNEHPRTYWVQVEQIPTEEAIQKLREGVELRIEKEVYKTLPARVRLLENEPLLPARNPPIRFRANIPTAWLEIELIEGKNKQVRRMTAAVGFPTLRLVRVAIGDLHLKDLGLGEATVLELRVRDLDKL